MAKRGFYEESHDMPQEESAHDFDDDFKVNVFYKFIDCVIPSTVGWTTS